MLAKDAPRGAFQAQQVPADPALMTAYFEKVTSYEADRLRSARRTARAGFLVGAIGCLIGVAGVAAVAAMAPLKAVLPLVFRVDNTTGAVERIYDVQGGDMAATEASTRYFLWQYVRNRQGYSAPEAQASFDAVALTSAPQVQNEYAAAFRGSNPNSPQVLLGRDGAASVRWLSTSMLGPRIAQVRFNQIERKGDTQLPPKRMVATIAFDFVPGQLSTSALNVNPLGFVVTSYRADMEATP
jgi:type IV secretion system protein VirB8